MSGTYSKKILLMTALPRITTPIRHALNRMNLEIAADFPALTQIPMIKSGVAHAGNTTFIRTELLRFIREQGYPRAIIMDSQIDIGAEAGHEPDRLKLLKTLMIAYIILSKGSSFRTLRGVFILLAHGAALNKELAIGKNPHALMKILNSQNPEIGHFIDELRESRERFDALFSFTVIDAEQPSDHVTAAVAEFLARTAPAGQASDQPAPAAAGDDGAPADDNAAPETAAAGETAARLVYRIDAAAVWDDGTLADGAAPEYDGLTERQFYLFGAWVARTELEVARKVAGAVQKGLGEKMRFNYNDVIVFNIDHRCVIDKNTTLSLGQLFAKNLAQYKKITLRFGPRHWPLVQKSRGFPIIREFSEEIKD